VTPARPRLLISGSNARVVDDPVRRLTHSGSQQGPGFRALPIAYKGRRSRLAGQGLGATALRRSLALLRRKPLTPIDAKPLSGAVQGRLRYGHDYEIRGFARGGEIESLTLAPSQNAHEFHSPLRRSRLALALPRLARGRNIENFGDGEQLPKLPLSVDADGREMVLRCILVPLGAAWGWRNH